MDRIDFPIVGPPADYLRTVMAHLWKDQQHAVFVGAKSMIDQARAALGKTDVVSTDMEIVDFDVPALAKKFSCEETFPPNWVFLLLPANYLQFVDLNRGLLELRQRGYRCLFVTSREYDRPDQHVQLAGRMMRPQMFFLAGHYTATASFNYVHLSEMDYYEFGCFDGASMSLAFAAFGHLLPKMRFVGFDTFAGISGAMPGEASFPNGDWAANRESFSLNMKILGVPADRLLICPGDISRTVADPVKATSDLGLRRCAIAHVDCDVYEPALAALNLLKHNMLSGGLVLFDDWDTMNASDSYGERRAAKEFLRNNPDITFDPYQGYGYHGRCFIFQRKDDEAKEPAPARPGFRKFWGPAARA